MPTPAVFAANNTALITGGASGIGLAVAQLCLKHGMRVSIADWNSDTLSKAKSVLGDETRVDTYQTDVSQPSAWTALKDSIFAKYGGPPNLLMLNAGIGGRGTWGDSEYFEKILSTNLFGILHGLNAFVPHYLQPPTSSPAGPAPSSIVITGSKQGITNPPGNPAYNASKSAVKTLAEHLSYDLRSTPTSVHLLVPGWTFTGLSGGGPGSGREKPAGAWTPEQVAGYMEEKMALGRFYIVCPDGDVSEELDRRRMLWAVGDVVEGRPPLSRWREEWKAEAEEWIRRKE